MNAQWVPEAVDCVFVDYQTNPTRYRHWRLSYDGAVATLSLDVQEDAGIRPGYKLKLNSYDLGVDIELHDALQRIRFEHPEVRTGRDHQRQAACVLLRRQHLHAGAVDPRVEGELLQVHQRNAQRYRRFEPPFRPEVHRRCNGSTAGGGYELALACDEIILMDDRSSSVSLPEVPLLGVLPGTGGLTRLTDKRKVRRDHADVFCTTPEGLQGQNAQRTGGWWTKSSSRSSSTAIRPRNALKNWPSRAIGPADAKGVALTPFIGRIDADGYHYESVEVQFDRNNRTATFTVRAPETCTEQIDGIVAGADWWPLQMARELDDAILNLRTNELELGMWIFKTDGESGDRPRHRREIIEHQEHWFVREVLGHAAAHLGAPGRFFPFDVRGDRTRLVLRRLAARTRAGRRSHLYARSGRRRRPAITLSEMNFGALRAASRSHRSIAQSFLRGCADRRLRSRDRSTVKPRAKRSNARSRDRRAGRPRLGGRTSHRASKAAPRCRRMR